LTATKAAEKQYGWTAAEVIGYPLEKFITNDYLGESLDTILQKISQDGYWKGEVTQNRRDGVRIPIITTLSILTNDAKQPYGFIAINRDLTERKLAEVAMQESEARYRTLFEQANDAIWILDLAEGRIGQILLANSAAAKMHGYSIAEMENLRITDLDVPDSVTKAQGRFEDIQKGEWISGETLHVRKDSTTFPIEFSAGPINFDGRPCVLAFTRDITERKQADEALRESGNRLELAVSSAQLGIWDWDIANNKMLWDDQMFHLYGIAEKPATYGIEIWQNGLHPDDIAFAWEECQAAIRGERKYDIEFRVRHPDESVKFIKADGMILRDENGKAVRMIGINRDITGQKRAEEEHLKYENQLQLNSKLESLGVLAGGIAHDFNNLMGGIFGYIDMASEASTENKVTSYLSKAMSTIDRARALTQQLLTFAKGGAPIQEIGQLFPFVEETC
jgi:PAS domain S-box-containing protein